MIAVRSMIPGSMTRLLSIDECRPELRQIHALWLRLRGDRTMPARRDFDPAQVPDLLPHLILVEVFADQPPERRYRVRLHGTAQAYYQGVDWTGAYPHDKTDREAADRLCAVGDQIVATRQPWISTGGLYWMPDKPYHRFETVLLPLSDDDQAVNMVLGLTIFF